jgi:hypothetical protein
MKDRAIRIVQLLLIVGAAALSAAPAPAQAQSSQTFNLGATTDVCNSCDLTTQEALASEDDRHDGADAGFDGEQRAENVSHDEADQAIEKSAAAAEQQQEALANEAERHQDVLKEIQRQQAIEASRHEQNLASIMAKAGKLLSDLVSNAAAGAGASASGGNPQPGGGQSAGGNPPQSAGAPPATSGGGTPPASGVPQSPPAQASGGVNASGGGESYPGGSPGGVPSVSPSAQPTATLGAKLGKFVQAAATRAINGIPQALTYFASTSSPAAQNLQNQWTNPMSPQDAATMVAGAWLSEAAGAGISGGKGAYNNAVANGATPQAAAQSALKTGTSFFSNRAAAMASGGTAGGSIANGGLGGYGGQTVTNGMPGQRGVLVNRGGANGGGPGNPTATGGSPAPDEGGSGPLGNYLKANFTSNLPPDIENALNNFNNGTLGQSVKGITPTQLQGKTWQQVVQEFGQPGGGWEPGDTPGTYKSGNWTLSQKFADPLNYPDPKGIGNPAAAETDLTNPNKVPQIFISNSDGGVVRIKPWGVPGGNYTSMQQPHYALYAKTTPGAGLDWNAEAFKVVDGQAIPKTPFQIQPPAGVPKWTPAGQQWADANPTATKLPDGANANQYYSQDFENWLQQSGWPNAGHQPLGKSWWSPNALGKVVGSSTAQ